MGNLRSVDPLDFTDTSYEVRVSDTDRFKGGDPNFDIKLDYIIEWLDIRCTRKYMILLDSVWFISEKDALIFKIGYANIY